MPCPSGADKSGQKPERPGVTYAWFSSIKLRLIFRKCPSMPIRRVSPAAAKLALHEAMVRGGVPNVELARRLGADEKMVRRLRDPLHGSRIEAVEAALRVLGKRLEISARAVT